MSAGADRHTVRLADGRSLPVLVTGPADGLPLLFHTGTPAGLVEPGPFSDIAASSGWRPRPCSADACRAAATIAGVAPYQAAGLDWFAGMGPENVGEFGAAAQGQEPLASMLAAEAAKRPDIAPVRLLLRSADW